MKFTRLALLALFFVPSFLIAQNFSGVATYNSSTKFDLKLDSTQIPPERIKMIYERMRKELFKEYELSFNKSESMFKEVEELDQAEGGRGMGFIVAMAGGAGSAVYKDLDPAQMVVNLRKVAEESLRF